MSKSGRFLRQVSESFAKACTRYYVAVGELPFVHRERQITTMLLSALVKVSDAVLMEQPISRGTKGKSTYGWLDYWVLHGSTTFLIELKYSWLSIYSKELRTGTQKAWSNAVKQVRSISQGEARDLAFASSDHVVKLAIMIVPSYRASRDCAKLERMGREQTRENSKEIFDPFVKRLRPAANWCCLWSLHEDLQGPHELDGKVYELYPCAGIVAMVANAIDTKRKS